MQDAAFSDPNSNQSNSVQNKKNFFVALGWRCYCGIYASNSLPCKCGCYLSCAFNILAVSCEASLIVKKDLIERSHRC